jgi:hypothetical protein
MEKTMQLVKAIEIKGCGVCNINIKKHEICDIRESESGPSLTYKFQVKDLRGVDIDECASCTWIPLNICTDGKYINYSCKNCANEGRFKIPNINKKMITGIFNRVKQVLSKEISFY